MSRALVSCLPFFLAAAGCVSKSEAETFEIRDGFERVDIDLPTGAVIVVGHDAAGATVDATSHWQGSRKPDLDVGVEGDALVLRVDCGALSICSVDAQLSLPRGVELAMDGATGDLTVREFDGKVKAALSTGSIILAEVGGELDLHTTTGDVQGTEVKSKEVDVRATTGKVALAFVEAPDHVDVDVTTGRVDLELPAGGYALDAVTTTGSVVLEVEQDLASERRVDVRTTTGDIKVHPG